MEYKFDIIEYLSGLTGYVFDKSVLIRIALDRDVIELDHHSMLDQRTRDLLLADLLFTVYIGANSTASYSVSDGAFKEAIGSQTINSKKEIYDVFYGIYKAYGEDEKLAMVKDPSAPTLEWVNENEWD